MSTSGVYAAVWTGSLRWAAALLTLFVAVGANAVPEPEPVPVRWEFDFKPEPLRLVRLDVQDEGPVWFAFLTYRVANHSGQDRMLAPLFELATDRGDVVRSGRGVPRAVTEAIMKMLDDPLLQDQLNIVGTLLQGMENTERGLAIWRLPSDRMDELIVFGAGFSGESQAFFTQDPKTGERVRSILRKTRMLRYGVPGDITPESPPEPEVIEDRWILR
ncbi:MAG: hypothetical protein H6810_12730 [Phycisphaeraceae bacterium]|nr:MAG: hypothetical protein H6810_12730 [Phycisphaeraceae bacterium]